jgi:hypothetical protein
MLMVGPGVADGAATEAEGCASEPDGTEPGADDKAPEPDAGAVGEPQALATSAPPTSAAQAASQARERRRMARDGVIESPSDGDSVRAW